MNFLAQVSSITLFSLKTIPARIGSVLVSAVGIAGVVAVLVGVLSIAEGFRAAMSVKAGKDVALVLRAGADSEMSSGLSGEEVKLISEAPGIAKSEGATLASSELFVVIDLPLKSTGTSANVPLRGVGGVAGNVRGDFKIVSGKMFEPGLNQIVAGVGAARAFEGLGVGNKLRVGQTDWEVVGIFTGGGGSAESEVWTDAAILQQAYDRGNSYQSVLAKLVSEEAFEEFKDSLTTNPQLKVKVMTQSEYLSDQSVALSGFIETLGVIIATLMALGALFGALNTMYSAVSARTREIATLRALGFSSDPIVVSVMIESLVIAVVGGIVGAAAAYIAFDGITTATINWQTFSQVAFAFAVTPQLLVSAIIWAAAIGVVGGLFPAIRAARLPIASALREG
ncbi:MAG: FtsX-like permease family protein [Planctomycetes bacterium]|nr:FtsX-like permease family protein [Planctomycetota bacterium]